MKGRLVRLPNIIYKGSRICFYCIIINLSLEFSYHRHNMNTLALLKRNSILLPRMIHCAAPTILQRSIATLPIATSEVRTC
jgi:hypothetical protein